MSKSKKNNNYNFKLKFDYTFKFILVWYLKYALFRYLVGIILLELIACLERRQ